MSYSIIIPSKNVDNLRACVAALRTAGETARVIWVDDRLGGCWEGSEVDSVREVCGKEPHLLVVEGRKPFCFARNVNLGIMAAGEDDVALLNDDVLLQSNGGLATLGKVADFFGYAAVSPRVKGPAHLTHSIDAMLRARQFNREAGTPISEREWFPFVCVYITRRALQVVGELDERFVPGGFEDNDWCRRAVDAGGRLAVCNGVLVDHETLPHTFRPADGPDLYEAGLNQKRYVEKWGKAPV